jgi:hypothetical protein
MAGIAVLCGPDVTTMFTCCRGAVMTAFTGAHHSLVIDPRNPFPTECRMTKLTGVVCPDMRGRRLLADRRTAVVAGETVAADAAVIESGEPPIGGGVTIVANVVAANMSR